MKKKIIIASVGFIIVLLAVVIAVFLSDLSGMSDIELRGLNLTSFDDGSYVGTFEHGRFTNTLIVHVESNEIIGIDIYDDVFAASVTNASDEVFRRVIEVQNTRIDAVSGATATTNAYLKAIENAFMR